MPNFQINEVILGDALEEMDKFPTGCMDAIITDPPYFNPAEYYATRKKFQRRLVDLAVLESFYEQVFLRFDRILKRTGALCVFCDGQSYPIFFAHLFERTKSLRPIIWDKGKPFLGYDWRHQFEIILFGTREDYKSRETGQGDIIRCPATNVHKRQHPAEKPVELLSKIVESMTDPRNLVLDPFLGTGTTAIACKLLKRNYIGIEIDPKYKDMAENRIHNTQTLFSREATDEGAWG